MTKVRVFLLVLAGILALSYCSQARAQAKLLGDDTGWAIRVGLQWTNNDGKDWQQITPPAVLDGGWSLVDAFFLNTSNGWVLMQKGWPEVYGQFAVATTNNGGLSWSVKPVNLPSFYQNALSGGGTIDFLDPMNGWVNLGVEGMSRSGFLFSTDDGGESWRRVKGVGIAGEVRFITMKEGWVHGGDGENELFGTHDGGKTWEEVSLPPPRDLGLTSTRNYYLPRFQDPDHGYLPVGFTYMGTASAAVFLFQTADGGRTWKPTKGVVSLPFAYEVPLSVADSTLFVVEQTGLYKTALLKATPDGRVERLPGPWAAIGSGITLNFLNSAHGWARGAGGDVLVTTDGGQTWTNPAPVHHGQGFRMPLPARKAPQPPQK
jgi:photosystem II stability/assembly factor-like uncharacterized protein